MKARILLGGISIAAAALLVAALLASGGSNLAAAAVEYATGPTNTSRPTITGTARDGQTLTGSSGTWSSGNGSAITYAYQWQRCDSKGAGCANIVGATASRYTLTGSDVDRTVGLMVTATDSSGSATAYSDLAGPVAPKGTAPAYKTQPTISGSALEGATLTASAGTWTGSTPITFTYQWMRCDAAGKNCALLGKATASTKYVLTHAEVGHTIIVGVIAKNSYGTQTGFTNPTAVVAAKTSLLPAYTVQPSIAGTAAVGQTLTASPGTWSGAQPMTYTFQWDRCDAGGKNCGPIAGATANTYTVNQSDAGHVLLVGVTAKNAYGTQTGFTKPTAPVAVAGRTALSVAAVSLPNRLVVSGVSFAPGRISPATTAFSARFRVTDSAGHPIVGALVYAIALPYGRVSTAPEAQTDGAGYATIPFHTLHRVGARRGYIVFFVRARKPGDSLLAGVSTRRLVQVTTGY